MSEDDSSSASDSPEKTPEKRRSWLERLSSAISGEPSTRDDLIELLRDTHSDGLIEADTLRMMEGALAVSDMTVGDVMVPRSQMVALPADARLLDLMKQVVESGHSRFPVHGEDKDEILGILLAKDLLRGVVADNGPQTIHSLLRPAVLIPESKKLNVLLREFRQSRNHMAIVIDEYGGVAGLVTIEDVLEEIVGEIHDEHDRLRPSLTRVERPGEWVVDASLHHDEVFDLCGFEVPEGDYDTLAGYVLAELGRIPEVGARIDRDPWTFVVTAMDGLRVAAVKITRTDPPTEEEASR